MIVYACINFEYDLKCFNVHNFYIPLDNRIYDKVFMKVKVRKKETRTLGLWTNVFIIKYDVYALNKKDCQKETD